MPTYTLSPSDLTFLWDGCPHCFYLKVKHKLQYSGVFPSMFGKMGNLTSEFYAGKPSSEISPNLPPGALIYKEKWVKSAPIPIPGSASEVVIRGRFDAVIAFEGGSFGIVDYKTSEASDDKAAFYGRQLSAYAYALENPAPGALHLAPITRLGLFVITPQQYERLPDGRTAFVSKTVWVEVARDDASFLDLLGQVAAVLDAPQPPPAAEGCGLCTYFHERGSAFPG